MAWFSTTVLAAGSVGILGYALMLTRRLYRDEPPAGTRRRDGSR